MLKKVEAKLPPILRNYFFELCLFALCVFFLLVIFRMNIFRYNNFDFGKFDLGNMTQMVWNTLQGRPLYLTDYFGTNLPRWAMSHVDPILLLFAPVFALYPHPLTLVFSQITLVIFSALLVFKIAQINLLSKGASFLIAVAYLLYPALGYLNALTGFHGVTAAVPFFFAAFYVFEAAYKTGRLSKRSLVLFWLFLIVTMMGKEQLPLYIMLYGVFIMFFRFLKPIPKINLRNILVTLKELWGHINIRLGLSMVVVGISWFYLAFFILIPGYAHYRVEGFERFSAALDIDPDSVTNVDSSNYFLSRYEEFGDSYVSILLGMLSDPDELIRVMFAGDKLDNFNKTLKPVMYLPFLYPQLFFISAPDFLINYATTAGGIGTAEITNHRISMIIPILFISTIYAINLVASVFAQVPIKRIQFPARKRFFILALSLVLFVLSINTSYGSNNPVYMWIHQAVVKRFPAMIAFAKTDAEFDYVKKLNVGDRFRLSPLDNKDRECAEKVIKIIPDTASVSGPDYLGAHLSMRETYAIFPALYKSADYVIVDVFSQKILRILELDLTLVRDVVADVIKSDNHKLILGCGNLFVYKHVDNAVKSEFLPLQERFNYKVTRDEAYEIFQGLHVADFTFPTSVTRGTPSVATIVYTKKTSDSLDDYVLFLSFVNAKTGEIYQMANLPSYALNQLRNWEEDLYYIESLDIAVPEFLDAGTYKVLVGMYNNIRTRSIYLTDIIVN